MKTHLLDTVWCGTQRKTSSMFSLADLLLEVHMKPTYFWSHLKVDKLSHIFSFLFNRVASMPRWETPTARLHSTSYTSSLQHRPAERSNNCWGVRHTDGWNNGLLVHRWMDGWKHKRMDGLNDGFMDGRIDGWIDACMGEWRGEWFPNLFSFYYIHRYIQNKICT